VPERAKRLEGLRLLVVEDNKINQMVAKGLLSKEGADITMADNGELGVAAVAGAVVPFDAVLMDVQMPVMDGYTATRKIREELALTALPIIAMTANAMASDREACLQAGMDDHVGKPFNLDQLVATLQRLCRAT
jgi:CheY-like chemotaxis protein